jgi:hypothetical protein
MKKIGIICLANGPYAIFIENLIQSCEEKFLPNYQKEYFIITDDSFKPIEHSNVNIIFKPRNGWPLDCLLRPQYSHELKTSTQHLDYIYFFNANMSIHSEIGEEILPDESGLVGVEHIHYTHKNNLLFTYDQNPLSKACIPKGDGLIYYQACLWGGTQKKFMELSETIQLWADEDLKNKVEPIWLDESYLNKYFLLNPPKTLPPHFAFPTSFPLYSDSPSPKILQLDKKDYISNENFRFI